MFTVGLIRWPLLYSLKQIFNYLGFAAIFSDFTLYKHYKQKHVNLGGMPNVCNVDNKPINKCASPSSQGDKMSN